MTLGTTCYADAKINNRTLCGKALLTRKKQHLPFGLKIKLVGIYKTTKDGKVKRTLVITFS